jgi:ubiquinone/menaquinone biosynthesis C-methylase UbiE
MVLKIVLIVLGSIIAYLVFMAIIGARILRKFVHFPAPPFVAYFLDSKLRRKMQPPEELIKRSGIARNMTVLEIGCGSGAYTTHISRAVGNKGIVYALDIQPKMLQRLQNKLNKIENKDITNIKTILGNAYELPFGDHSIDLVCMITVLQEIPDKLRSLKEVKRVLKTKGILAVTELLVDPDYPWKKTTVRMVTDAGFKLQQAQGNTLNYTITFAPDNA